MTRTIIILGASVAGIPIAHYLLKHTIKSMPDLRVVLVSPNSHLYWNLASSRGILPNKFDDRQLFYPLAPAFAKYPPESFEHILGTAEKLDPSKAEVTVLLNGADGQRRTLTYHAIVVATGSSAREGMPWKNLGSTEETQAALATFRRRIAAAQTIVVAGAGATGSELAGELGTAFGRSGEKNIILVSSDELPLDQHTMRSLRETVKAELEHMKVRLIVNAKTSVDAQTVLEGEKVQVKILKRDGTTETIDADAYLPTFGMQPNTAFLPPEMLDSKGFVQQTPFLRARGYDNIFVVGDAGSLQPLTAVNADKQAVHVVKNIEAFLGGITPLTEFNTGGIMQFGVAMGDRGTGQLGNWKIWSILVWFVKGRYLGTQYAGGIAAGDRTMLSRHW